MTPLLLLVACSPLENNARDTAAALGGALTSAMAQNKASCQANPSQAICTAINDGIKAENTLIQATEAYCGFTPGTLLTPNAPHNCQPVKGATSALQAAVANAQPFITALKGGSTP